MIKIENLKRRRKSQAASLAMLCLLAHAFFVSVTHHHYSPQDLSANGVASVNADSSGGSGATPGSAGDAHCLSCRLQRNFASNVHTASIIVQPLEEPLIRETPSFGAAFTGSALLLSGRAPPLS